MKASNKIIEKIKEFEGCRLTAYQCSAGTWTIGYGHTKGVTPGMTITQAQADAWLTEDVNDFASKVDSRLRNVRVNQNQFDALVSFAYNLGLGNLDSSTLLKKVKANPNDPTIRNEFKRWIYSGGRPNDGLLKRREAEADFYFGTHPSPDASSAPVVEPVVKPKPVIVHQPTMPDYASADTGSQSAKPWENDVF